MSGPITRLLSMGGAWPTNPNPHPVGDHLMQVQNRPVQSAVPCAGTVLFESKAQYCDGPKPGTDGVYGRGQEVPTHIAPQYDYSIDNYVAYNKPLAITHWLQTTKVPSYALAMRCPVPV
eukprot:1081562-Rhodomonas_salina.1